MYQGISADRLSSDPEPVKRSGMFFSCRIHSLDAKTFYLCNVTNFRKLIFFAVLAIVRNGMAAPPDTNIDSLIEYAAAQGTSKKWSLPPAACAPSDEWETTKPVCTA